MSSKYWLLTINNPSYQDYLFFSQDVSTTSYYQYSILLEQSTPLPTVERRLEHYEQYQLSPPDIPKQVVFFTGQMERGIQGTPHLQIYIEFTNRKRLTYLRKLFPTCHAEVRRGTQKQAITYCTKEETRIHGPYTFGNPTETNQGARNDLRSFIDTMQQSGLRRAIDEDPCVYVKYARGITSLQSIFNSGCIDTEQPTIMLLIGPPGCGKTRAFYDYVRPRFLQECKEEWSQVVDPNRHHSSLDGEEISGTTLWHQGSRGGIQELSDPPKPLTFCRIPTVSGYWFDGYMGQECVLLDDFDGKASKWTLAQTLSILDRYPLNAPTKGGFTFWKPKEVWVTTNIHPRKWFEWENRENQYDALKRRFTVVREYNYDGTFVLYTPDLCWSNFWNRQ